MNSQISASMNQAKSNSTMSKLRVNYQISTDINSTDNNSDINSSDSKATIGSKLVVNDLISDNTNSTKKSNLW